jgi:plasmid maintenance system killer protein
MRRIRRRRDDRLAALVTLDVNGAVRYNDQWRICFKWSEGDAEDVEIADYH